MSSIHFYSVWKLLVTYMFYYKSSPVGLSFLLVSGAIYVHKSLMAIGSVGSGLYLNC